jgi:DNA-binding response OmpR family regulator
LKTAALELVDNKTILHLGEECLYDFTLKSIFRDAQEIKLSKNESKLLEYFIQRANQVVSFEDIFDYIWEYDAPSKEAMKSLIKDIRRKIGKDYIKNVYGIGYIFERSSK